jgi:hypothetical protein
VEYCTETVRDVEPTSPAPTPPPASPPVEEHVEPGEHEQEVNDENLDADHNDALLQLHTIDDLIGDVELPGLARRVLNAELNFTSAKEPIMHEEMKAI